MKSAHALDARVLAVGIDQRAGADHVVGDDHAALTRELERPGEVIGRGLLVGVDEDQVEGSGCLGRDLGQLLERGSDAQLDDVSEPRARDVLGRDTCVGGLRLDRDEVSTGR